MMKSIRQRVCVMALLVLICDGSLAAAEKLKVHGIFRSNMVLQRDKPIKIWGWAPTGTEVKVSFGTLSATGKASGDAGLWEATFEPQAASMDRMSRTRTGEW